jgi:O-antigen/teichoic acid export membrane protein
MNQGQRSELSLITIQGTIWTFMAKYVGKPVAFISTLLLVRLLSPEDFGIAAYSHAVISFLNPVSTFGLDLAIVFHREDDDTANTAFWMGLGFGLGLFALVWLFAPIASLLFPDPRAVDATRVLALAFPLSALGRVHASLLEKQLSFRKQTPPALMNAVGKGLVSVGLAALGLGVWALIWGEIAAIVIGVITYWIVLPWRPAFRFSRLQAWSIFTYGGPMVVANWFGSFMSNAHQFLIGHYLGTALLGVYNIAYRIPNLLVMDLSRVQNKVLFPLYVKYQDDIPSQRSALLQTLRQVALLVVPASLGLALIAEPFVVTFLSEEWNQTIPVMRAISVYALIYALERLANALLRAQGRLKIFMFLMTLQALLLLPALWWAVAVNGSIVTVGWVYAGVSLVSTLVIFAVVRRFLMISWREFILSIHPALSCGGVMSLAVLVALRITAAVHPVLQLSVATLVGLGTYALASWWWQREVVASVSSALATILRRVPRVFSALNHFNR